MFSDSEEEEFAYMRTAKTRRIAREAELRTKEDARIKAIKRKQRKMRRLNGEIVSSTDDSEREDDDDDENDDRRDKNSQIEVIRGGDDTGGERSDNGDDDERSIKFIIGSD